MWKRFLHEERGGYNTDSDSGGGAHPDLATHDALGLATDAELTTHAATAHGSATHEADAADAHDASAISILDTAADFTATDVEGALAELQSDNETHDAAADPHAGYQKESEKGAASGYASLDAGGTVPDAQIPAAIARDSELHAQLHAAAHADGAADEIVDATQAPSTQAFGDAATAGADTAKASPVLHKHAMPADPVTAHVAAADPHTGYTLTTELTTHEGAADPHTGYRLESADHAHQSTGAAAGQLDHGLALTGLADDDHPQYAAIAQAETHTQGPNVFQSGGAATVALVAKAAAAQTAQVFQVQDSTGASVAAIEADGAMRFNGDLHVGGSTRYTFGTSAFDQATRFLFLASGGRLEVLLEDGSNYGTVQATAYQDVNGAQVVGTRQAANADTAGATLAALETEVNQLKAALRAHGLIAT